VSKVREGIAHLANHYPHIVERNLMTFSPVFIPCASGNNAQTDALVKVTGSLVCILGHAEMQFTPCDGVALGHAILDASRSCGWKDLEVEAE
jgi:hypothetical protein